MFGVLVARDAQGSDHVLQAFSGQWGGRWNVPGFVGPVLDEAIFDSIIKRNNSQIWQLTDQVAAGDPHAALLRRQLTLQSQGRIFDAYRFCCADGILRSFSDMGILNPCSGTGDCCEPKLLHAAFSRNLIPIAMAMFYVGGDLPGGQRHDGQFYEPCASRCRMLLPHLLCLDVVYADEQIVVVDKASGLLSVPGRGDDKQDCVESRMRRLFPDSVVQPAVHRLDQDTSGLLVLARDAASHRNLSMQFMQGTVGKRYEALLDGVVRETGGVVQLPFRLDVDNRPRQIHDPVNGKMGITKWERLAVQHNPQGGYWTHVAFTPLTGRTHQLRLHSSHELGLAHPILGDRLYGDANSAPRLMLHATDVSFVHPMTGELLSFHSDAPFASLRSY